MDYQKGVDVANISGQYNLAGKQISASRGSGSIKKESDKVNIDVDLSNWIYSPYGFDENSYLYSDWNEETNPIYAARDKLNNPEIRSFILNTLVDNGYTAAQAQSKMKEYDKNLSEQVSKKEE